MIGILQKIKTDDKDIVDLGAGSNSISKYITCKSKITVDFNDNFHPDIVYDFNNDIPLDDDSCDIVIAGEILEYSYFSNKFLKEIKRILRQNGYLLISVPNICSIKYRIAWLFGRIPPYAAKADYTYTPPGEKGGHGRDYTFKELEKILISLGYRIIKSTTNGVIFNKFYIPHYLIRKTFGQKVNILAKKIN
jgi:SAM-dependent methyltransferase